MNRFFEIAGSSIVIVCMVVFMLFCGDSSFYSGELVGENTSIISSQNAYSENTEFVNNELDNSSCCSCEVVDTDNYECLEN